MTHLSNSHYVLYTSKVYVETRKYLIWIVSMRKKNDFATRGIIQLVWCKGRRIRWCRKYIRSRLRGDATEVRFQFSALRKQAGCSWLQFARLRSALAYIRYPDNIPRAGPSLMANKLTLDKFYLSLSFSFSLLFSLTILISFARSTL